MALPDILAPNLDVVFCGSAVASASAAAGHYYARPGNRFWRLLNDAGFTPRQLSPQEDGMLPSFGVGLTDLARTAIANDDRALNPADFDVDGLIEKVERFEPRWLALNGITTTGGAVAVRLGFRKPRSGEQTWSIGATRIFVLPQSSGRSRVRPLPVWSELAELVYGPTRVSVVLATDSSHGVVPDGFIVTPDSLGDELGVRATAIRGWARAQGWRNAELKGQQWAFSEAHVEAIRGKFAVRE